LYFIVLYSHDMLRTSSNTNKIIRKYFRFMKLIKIHTADLNIYITKKKFTKNITQYKAFELVG